LRQGRWTFRARVRQHGQPSGNSNRAAIRTEQGRAKWEPLYETTQIKGDREALKKGLELGQSLGTNPPLQNRPRRIDRQPHRAGDGRGGEPLRQAPGTEPHVHRWEHVVGKFGPIRIVGWRMAASGCAGVWASANNREAVFDTMQRKEVYATTGPRMLVRFVGGGEFTSADARRRLPVDVGHAQRVPISGDLPRPDRGAHRTFLAGTMKDP